MQWSAGNDSIIGSEWNSLTAIVVWLLKLIISFDGISVERNALSGATFQETERSLEAMESESCCFKLFLI